MIRQTNHKKTITAQDMDANENIVERLKQWMEDEGMEFLRGMLK